MLIYSNTGNISHSLQGWKSRYTNKRLSLGPQQVLAHGVSYRATQATSINPAKRGVLSVIALTNEASRVDGEREEIRRGQG